MKRLFDVLVSTVGLIVLSPIMLLLAIAVKLSSPGPVLYMGERVGLHGKPFRMAKFRSMRVNADKQGSSITTKGDSRVTSIGRILRRTKLDEIPQLFNVLIGHMSLVGPRPETPPWVALYTEQQKRVLSVRPGITDPAQIMFRHEEDYLKTDRHYKALMQHKLDIQLRYIDQQSFFGDLRILLKTVCTLFERHPSAEAMSIYNSISQEN